MARNITVGIDIGTYQIKVLVAESIRENDRLLPRIIGSGFAESKGLRHGYIINPSDVLKSISVAVAQAEKTSGVKIKRAFLSVGGIGLSGVTSQGSIIISRADSQVSELDMEKAMEICEHEIPPALSLNRKIIHAIPISYKIDGKPILGGNPIGMRGTKLEVKALFISALEHHVNDLIQAVEDIGVDVVDVITSPIAASFVTLSKTQKIAGCVLANIGAETISIVVFENNIPISLEVFPMGSTDITHDIALGFKIPLEEAEDIKIGTLTGTSYSRKKLDEIISSRLYEMFELIEAHLKKINRSGLLPAGIIITGGGSGMGSIEEIAKTYLKLPSRIATINVRESSKGQIKDSTWSVAYGLCILGLTSKDDSGISIKRIARGLGEKLFGWIKKLLP